MGPGLEDCVVYDPRKPGGGLTPEQLRAATVIPWRGHCSVHSMGAQVRGEVVNRISVDARTAQNARLAVDRMPALP